FVVQPICVLPDGDDEEVEAAEPVVLEGVDLLREEHLAWPAEERLITDLSRSSPASSQPCPASVKNGASRSRRPGSRTAPSSSRASRARWCCSRRLPRRASSGRRRRGVAPREYRGRRPDTSAAP